MHRSGSIGDPREGLEVGESNPAFVKSHKAATLPFAKTTAHAFLRNTGHCCELALRCADVGTRAVGQAQESLRQPSIEVGKGELGNPSVGAAKARAQGFEELQTNVGMPLKERADVTTLEHEELARGESNGVRCAAPVRQQGDLPKDFAGGEIGQQDLVTARGSSGNADRARRHHHHALSGGPGLEDHLASGEAKTVRVRGKLPTHVLVEGTEQGASLQQLVTVPSCVGQFRSSDGCSGGRR
jgi:hypothetical protein